jgi:hypothetical protein
MDITTPAIANIIDNFILCSPVLNYSKTAKTLSSYYSDTNLMLAYPTLFPCRLLGKALQKPSTGISIEEQ